MESRQHHIPRKPVPLSPLSPPPPYVEAPYVESPTVLSATSTAEYSSYDGSTYDHYDAEQSTRERLHFLSVDDPAPATSPTPPPRSTQSSPNFLVPEELPPDVPPTPTAGQKASQAAISAYQEARHFAGGLVSHPFEATKHYSILRHSHGLVFYSGSFTNIAISIFSDRPLPPDRSFWLQRRGWSGKTGLRAGVLFGTHGAWIDVTPETIVSADQVKPTDERAWQRDISKFLRKAPRKLADHVPRETAVLRVPCEAQDGYLRIVMCCGENGKKHLCTSPIFRLASTSHKGSSIRGASLSTLPLEAAVKVGSSVGMKMAKAAAAPYVASAKAFVATQATSIYQPSTLQSIAAERAYDESGGVDRLEKMERHYEARRAASGNGPLTYDGITEDTSMTVGPDDGPTQPFPIRFGGKVSPEPALSPISLPALSIAGVDSNILLKHSGIFFGYVSISLPKKSQSQGKAPESASSPDSLIDDRNRPAIISIAPHPTSQAAVVLRKQAAAAILSPLPTNVSPSDLTNSKISLLLMAYLRPAPPLHILAQQPPEEQARLARRDAHIAVNSLSRPNWAADMTLQRVKTASSQRSMGERYVDARRGVQDQVDKVPAHWLGIRMGGQIGRDGFVGRGGISIPR